SAQPRPCGDEQAAISGKLRPLVWERFVYLIAPSSLAAKERRLMRRLGNENQGIEEFVDDDGGAVSSDHPHVRGFLPGDHPHPQLYHSVTPIWHGGDSPEDLEDRFGEAYTCGFSTGFERGIAMAVTRPAGSAQFG